MGESVIVLTPVVSEPLTLGNVKDYLNIDFSDKDLVLSLLITRARSYAETVTHRALATQQLRHMFTIERPIGGTLSGPINPGPDWYQYNEMLGANPFGPSHFYFSLAMPPIQGDESNIVVETKVTAFAPWQSFPLQTNPDGSRNMWLDSTLEPSRLYLMSPVTANFYRFTYTAGYSSAYPCPPDLMQAMYETIAYWYDNREAEDLPQALINKLLAKRVDWV